MKDPIGCKVKIMGRVQGVFFRAETRNAALNLGIMGYVKNLPDGSVEAFFQGSRPDVENMLGWCKKGSPASRVDDVIHEPMPFQDDLTGFQVLY
ncbi:acylphosphatase [Desulfospira joergensenii]|uniref:acylphosphatase n=1 Tax=Desulfospira joergensenii TaxID=53329 RepID=UPI00040F8907|nr:acylphosphatase [Desulfospira joergensenii]